MEPESSAILRHVLTSEAAAALYTARKAAANAHTGEESILPTINSPTKTAYTLTRTAAPSDQLVAATVRLADLFNAIAWP